MKFNWLSRLASELRRPASKRRRRGSVGPTSQRAIQRPSMANLESLENRTLLASFSFYPGDGVLHLANDSGGVSVEKNADMLVFQANSWDGNPFDLPGGATISGTTLKIKEGSVEQILITKVGSVGFAGGIYETDFAIYDVNNVQFVDSVYLHGSASLQISAVGISGSSSDLISSTGDVTLNSNVISLNTIYTDEGNVTIDSGSVSLSSINTGAGDVTIDSGTFILGTGSWIATAQGDVRLTASRDIGLLSGSSVTSASGDVTLSANQGTSSLAGNFSGVVVNNNAKISSGTGTVTVEGRGGSEGDAGLAHGVSVNGGRIVGGIVNVTGQGGSGSDGVEGNRHGMNIQDGGLIEGDNVTVNGDGGVTPKNVPGGNHGVNVAGTSAAVLSRIISSGDLTVTGNGGDGGDFPSNGVDIYIGLLSAGGAATVIGYGSENVTPTDGWGGTGVSIAAGATITSGGDGVIIRGRGGNGTSYGDGVFLGGTVSATGTGTGLVFIRGRRGTAGRYGVSIANGTVSAPQEVLIDGNGMDVNNTTIDASSIIMEGQEGDRDTARGINLVSSDLQAGAITLQGGDWDLLSEQWTTLSSVYVDDSTVQAGTMTIRGRGESSGSHGVLVQGNSSNLTSIGNITIEGTASAAAASGVRVESSSVTSTGGSISITGTNSNTSAVNVSGVRLESGQVTGGGADIDIVAGSLKGEGLLLTGNSSIIGSGSNTPLTVSAAAALKNDVELEGTSVVQSTGDLAMSGSALTLLTNVPQDNPRMVTNGSGDKDRGDIRLNFNSISLAAPIAAIGNIYLTADDMVLGELIDAAGNDVVLRPQEPFTTIHLGGGEFEGEGGPTELFLSESELNPIIANQIIIGSNSQDGDITFEDPLVFVQPKLEIITSGSVMQGTSFSGTVFTVSELAITSGRVGSSNRPLKTAVSTFEFDGIETLASAVHLSNIDPLRIVGVTGQPNGTVVDISSQGPITVAGAIESKGEAVTLASNVSITINAGAVVDSGGDKITLNAGSLTVESGGTINSVSPEQSGNIKIGTSNLDLKGAITGTVVIEPEFDGQQVYIAKSKSDVPQSISNALVLSETDLRNLPKTLALENSEFGDQFGDVILQSVVDLSVDGAGLDREGTLTINTSGSVEDTIQ